MPSIDVFDLTGKRVEKFEMDPDIFGAKVNEKVMYQAIQAYRNNQRQGSASTKTRGKVRGGGRKPWRQKGTGRARVGSIRSPLWRGGGKVFGPHTRDYSIRLPKKIKCVALISGLSAKYRDGEILMLKEDPIFEKPKTKDFAKILSVLKIDGQTCLYLVWNPQVNFIKSARNLEKLKVKSSNDFNLYDLLTKDRVIFSKETYKKIIERLKR